MYQMRNFNQYHKCHHFTIHSKNMTNHRSYHLFFHIYFIPLYSLQQIMRRPTQNQFSHSAQRSLKAYEFFPSSSISTSIKLHSSIYSPKTPSKDITRIGTINKDKIFVSSNIELSSSNPNHMVFHHYQKCNTFQFSFHNIFDQYAKPSKISASINLYHSLFQENKDVCVIAMGAELSGIQQLCQGSQTAHKKQGLFYQLMVALWNKLQSIKNQETSMGINSIRITLKMLAIEDEKLYDMLSPKTQVTLKDNSHKVVIGCSSFEVMSVYDLHIKLMQVFHHKKLIYSSDCIAVIEAEITISKESYLITDQSVNVRYFTFIQWQRGNPSQNSSTPNKTKPQNSQSLLTLNMCIYQLYKISCHQPQNITQAQVKQLWANFRTTHITMILKYFFMRANKISYIGCLSLKETTESDHFQILMLGKNLGKIDLTKFIQYAQANGINSKFMQNSDVRVKKMKTEPIQSQSSSQQPSPNIKLRKLKQNLQRILKEKQSTQQNKKQQQMMTLFKQQKQRRTQLQNIRYKKQEIKIRQDYNKLHKISSHNNSRIIQKDNSQPITLPHLPQKKLSKLQPTQEQLSRLAKEQQNAKKRIASIHTQIMQSVQQQPNSRLSRNILQMEVKIHEKEMLEFVNNKNKILSLLKNQIRQLKAQEIESGISERPKGVSHAQRRIKIKSRIDDNLHFKTIQHKESKNNFNPETQVLLQQQQQNASPSPLLQLQPQQKQEKIFKLQALKKMNKNNYLFQKRRMLLKAKLSKGRQQLNQFYDQAAKKFQQYKSK